MPTSTPQIVTRLVQLGESANPADNFFLRAEGDGALSIARCSDGRVAALIGADNKVTFPGNVQTWQNMTTSRVLGVPYKNLTGQKIEVIATIIQSSAGSNNLKATIAGNYPVYGSTSSTSGTGSTLTFSVPAGESYTIDTINAATMLLCLELR